MYYGNNLPSGIEEKEYYVVRIDDDTLQFADTYKESTGIANVVDIVSIGGTGQSINPINPKLRPFANNDLVFDLSDSSLTGYQLKFYYGVDFYNEYVGSATSESFDVIGVSTFATVGIGSTLPLASNKFHPTATLKHSDNAPKIVFYNLFGPSGLSTTDNGVVNKCQIEYVDSSYSGTHKVTGIGATEFSINLRFTPESLQYSEADCDILEYTTQSLTATGCISTVRFDSP